MCRPLFITSSLYLLQDCLHPNLINLMNAFPWDSSLSFNFSNLQKNLRNFQGWRSLVLNMICIALCVILCRRSRTPLVCSTCVSRGVQTKKFTNLSFGTHCSLYTTSCKCCQMDVKASIQDPGHTAQNTQSVFKCKACSSLEKYNQIWSL